MKAIKLLVLTLTLTAISCGQNKPAQNKPILQERTSIAKEEYDSIRKETQANVDKKIRKVNSTDNRFSNNTIVTITQEYLPPDKSKWMEVEKTGNSVKNTEIIYIGDFEYRKEDGKDWAVRQVKNFKSNSKSGDSVITALKDESTTEYSVEEANIDNETFRILTSKQTNPQNLVLENKIWIDKEGLIYKEESKLSLGRVENLLSASITNYDYTVKDVKIEPPILSKKKK